MQTRLFAGLNANPAGLDLKAVKAGNYRDEIKTKR